MRRTLPSIAFITLIASAVAGCAADGTSGGSGPSGLPTAGGPSAVQPQSEESRVQAFLDAQYLRTDVLHEFRTKAGDDIDCVDFAAEPGVRALVAQGTPIEALRVAAGSTLPEAEQERSRTAATNDAYFTGEPDELGRARVCPEGTSPHVRISGEQITAAGGLEAFLADRTAKGPPPAMVAQGNASCPYINVSDYQWITGGWTDTFTAAGGKDYSVANLGGQSTMTIAQPVVPAGPDHSLQETWTVGYDPKTCVTQTVEAGWVVSSGVNGDLAPHVFLYATAGTYGLNGAPGCYNNQGSGCIPWVPFKSSLVAGQSLAGYVSTPGSTPQHELTVKTYWHNQPGTISCILRRGCIVYPGWTGWVVALSVDGGPFTELGYYPTSAFGAGPLATRATQFEVGGEVCDTTGTFTLDAPNVQMGEGSLPGLGPHTATGYAAVQHDYQYLDTSLTPQMGGAEPVMNWIGQGQNAVACPGNGDGFTCVYDWADQNVGAAGGAGAESSSWQNWFYEFDTKKLSIIHH